MSWTTGAEHPCLHARDEHGVLLLCPSATHGKFPRRGRQRGRARFVRSHPRPCLLRESRRHRRCRHRRRLLLFLRLQLLHPRALSPSQHGVSLSIHVRFSDHLGKVAHPNWKGFRQWVVVEFDPETEVAHFADLAPFVCPVRRTPHDKDAFSFAPGFSRHYNFGSTQREHRRFGTWRQ